jgi:cytochrome c
LVFMVAMGTAHADGKKDTVVSMLDAAAAHFSKVGKEQAYKDFSVKGGDFYKGEFYIAAYGMDSKLNEFHAVNPKLVGKNLMKLKDIDGKLILVEMYKVADEKGSGWVDYKWPHPETKKIAQKQTYIKVVGDVFLMIGYYE